MWALLKVFFLGEVDMKYMALMNTISAGWGMQYWVK